MLDVRLPDGDGVEVCREVRAADPEIRCLMLTSFADDEALFEAIMAGASGYVLKQIKGTDIVDAIRRVAAGESLLDPDATRRVLDRIRNPPEEDQRLASLTPQERRILELITDGLTNRQIAEEMFLAEKTVKNYVSNLLAKLGMERRTQAAVFGARVLPERGTRPSSTSDLGPFAPSGGMSRSPNMSMPFDRGLIRLNRDECMALLAQASFARVGVSVDALPAILPVTIALIDERDRVSHAARDEAGHGGAELDPRGRSRRVRPVADEGWSVLVRGVATELMSPPLVALAREQLTGSWIDGDGAEHYVAVSCDLVTGRRLRRLDQGASTNLGVTRTGERAMTSNADPMLDVLAHLERLEAKAAQAGREATQARLDAWRARIEQLGCKPTSPDWTLAMI